MPGGIISLPGIASYSGAAANICYKLIALLPTTPHYLFFLESQLSGQDPNEKWVRSTSGTGLIRI